MLRKSSRRTTTWSSTRTASRSRRPRRWSSAPATARCSHRRPEPALRERCTQAPSQAARATRAFLLAGGAGRDPGRSTVRGVSTGQFLVAFIVAGAAGTLVFFHADRHRIGHPSVWAGFVFLFLIIGLPAYAIHVRRVRRVRGR